MKSFNQYFKANQNQKRPIEQPSLFPLNFYSRYNYDSRNRSNSRNRYYPYRSSRLRSPSISRENSRSRYRYCYIEFISTRIPSGSRNNEFYNQRRNSISPFNSSRRNICYRSFSRSNHSDCQYSRNYNSLYWPTSRPRSRSASACRRFVNIIQPNFFENHNHFTESFQSWKRNLKLLCTPLKWQTL